jgi:hypothetical protein
MDCGCGGGSNCITKHKKEFKKWVKAELKRLDCGCGCKGMKKFEEKYGKLVGGKLQDCPPGWRNDGLTCVENCKPGEKDDGLTCRKPCEPGFVDDGLTCRKPITSSMNSCPSGSRDIIGTCWGPVRRDCIDDCFKHPAPGCKTWQCGRLEWAGIDWGPKLCTSCNLRCGQTCWDVWGITKQLHERELKVSGGEVQGKSIYSKEIRSRIDFMATNKEIEQVFIDAFGKDSELAKAFDPEKNGVADSFRKFGVDTKEAFDDIGRKIKEGFKPTPEFQKWLDRHKRTWERAFRYFFPPEFEELVKTPEFWIDVAIIMAEVAVIAAAAPLGPVAVMALSMLGPSIRMIVKSSKGEPIDAFDIASLVLAAVPGAKKGDKAAASFMGQMFQFVQRNIKQIQFGASVLIAGAKIGQALGRIPSTCIANCPVYDDSPMPPDDNPNPAYIPPSDPPPPGQKTDAELLAMAPGNRPFTKFLGDSDDVNPDYVGTDIKWIKTKRKELYNWPTPPETTTTPAGNLASPEDEKIEDVTTVKPDETQQNINTDFDDDLENAGFGMYRGGLGPEIKPLIDGNEIINPGGEEEYKLPTGKEPPKGPGGCEFNVKCYAQNYPDLFIMLGRNEQVMTNFWTDLGKEQGHNPCCGAKLEQGKNYEEDHVKCNARNAFYDKKTGQCDTGRNTKGIKKTPTQFREDRCKAEGSFWEKGYETYITEERTQPDFFTGKYEIRRTQHTRPTGEEKCDPERNLQGKNKKEEEAKQQAEANKRTIDRIVKEDFFPACYAANNPDVVAKVGNTDEVLEKHFREYGIDEQRSSACDLTLQEQKTAANKAKALEGFNAFCYAYNNPEIFEEISKPYFAIQGRRDPNILTEALKKHFTDVGYAQRLDYSCTARDTEYNWRCFSENMRNVKNAAYVGVAFDHEPTVTRLWNSQKNNSWETFDKGSCRDRNLSKSQQVRDFNAKCYAFNNPELVSKFGNNDSAYLEHFRSEGFDQGLETSCDVRNQTFKPECYAFANPDLATAFGNDSGKLTNHWNTTGKNEWRNINCTPEQAEIVFQKQYCQDTESFWDGTTCDLTRHTNGRPKEEISNDVLNAYYEQFAEADRERARKIYGERMENDVLQTILNEDRQKCIKSNGLPTNVREEEFLGSPITSIYCDLDRTPEGLYKKDLCNEQDEYYDQVNKVCDSSRNPDGLTETQIQIQIAEELEKEQQENVRDLQQRIKIQEYFDENYDALIKNEWKPVKYNPGDLVVIQIDDFPGWEIYERNTYNNPRILMKFHKTKPNSNSREGRLLWKKRPDLADVGKLDGFLKPTIIRLNAQKKQAENITDPVLLKKFEDCNNYSRTYNVPEESYFDLDANECLLVTPAYIKCAEEGGTFKSNFSRNPQLNKEPECIPPGGYPPQTQPEIIAENKEDEIKRRIEIARRKFMTEQYDLTAQIPGIKPNAYGNREQTIDSCVSNHIMRSRGKDVRTRIAKLPTSGGMIGCDIFTPENDPVFNLLKEEEAKIVREVTEQFDKLQAPLQPVEGPGGLFSGDELEGWGMPASLTLYWAKWCPHCHKILPIWKKLNFKGVKINALEEQETDFQVDSYPTIIFRNGSFMEKYTGKRTKAAILKFLKNKLS